MKDQRIHIRISEELREQLEDRQMSKFVRAAIRQRLSRMEAAEDLLSDWSRKELRSLMGMDLNLKHPLSAQIVGAMEGNRPRGVPKDRWESLQKEVLDKEHVALAVWTFCAT